MNTDNFINLTPHAIVIIVGDETFTFPPSGAVARVTMVEQPETVGCFPGIRRKAGAVVVPDLAQFQVELGDGADPFVPYWLIVSSMVLDAAQRTNHYLVGRMCAPDTGPTAIRENGQVKAVTRLVV